MIAQLKHVHVVRNWRLLIGLALLLALGAMLGRAELARAAGTTYLVNSTADTAGPCGNPCTLRQAIAAVNAGSGGDRIEFDLRAHSVIGGFSPLPAVTVPVTIDGTTNPDYEGSPVVAIIGETAGPGADGLVLNGANSVLKGVLINEFGGSGLVLGGGGATVTNCRFGTDFGGTRDVANGTGIRVASSNNVIGGTAPGDGNLVSGNTDSGVLISGDGNVLQGNFIGTDASGTAALSNANGVHVLGGGNNTIGGSAAGAGNLISGNVHEGVFVESHVAQIGTGNTVAGNTIGTDAAGTSALGNDIGVRVFGAENTSIGGSDPGAGNLISSNTSDGVAIQDFLYVQQNPFGPAFLYAIGEHGHVLGNTIGTDRSGAAVLGNHGDGVDVHAGDTVIGANLVSGNDGNGVAVSPGVNMGSVFGIPVNFPGPNTVRGNRIGTDDAGTAALGNGADGVHVTAVGTSVGGTAAGEGNVIGDNGFDGVWLGSSGNQLLGNHIGTDVTGTAVLGNHNDGVHVGAGANTVGGSASGAANVITNNDSRGIDVLSGAGTLISRNSIYGNGYQGIDLSADGVTSNDPLDADGGPNNLQNSPVLTQVGSEGPTTEVDGVLNSSPNATYTVEFFTNDACGDSGYGDGRTFLGSATVTTDQNGHVDYTKYFSASLSAPTVVTATATDQSTGDTSEFSPCEDVTRTSADLRVTKTASPTRTVAGTPVTFKVRVFNNGPFTSHNVSLVDSVPAGLTVEAVSTTQGSCIKAQVVRCDLGDLALDKTATVTIQVRATSVGTYRNTAWALGDENDASTTNNYGVATVSVNPNANGCTVVGTDGPDTLTGTSGPDVICGLGGNDALYGGAGNDTLSGGPGNDTIHGGTGNDTIYGGAGKDTTFGDAGTDAITIQDGVSGNDSADGGTENDTCSADSGDTVTNCP